jgi:cytochrome c
MVQKHPIVRQMLAEYYTPMPFQNLTEQDARAVLEYLRTIDAANDES